MAQTSATICYQIPKLLQRVDVTNILLTYGFVHQLEIKSSVPDSIVNFCAIYAFLTVSEWYKGVKDLCVISESKSKVTLMQNERSWSTAFANPVISQGRYKWKFKLLTDKADYLYVGIASNMRCLDDTLKFFPGSNSWDCYSYCMVIYDDKSRRIDHKMVRSDTFTKSDGEYFEFETGDILCIHLDLGKRTVGISRNKEDVVITFENIEQVPYRLAVTASRYSKYELEFYD